MGYPEVILIAKIMDASPGTRKRGRRIGSKSLPNIFTIPKRVMTFEHTKKGNKAGSTVLNQSKMPDFAAFNDSSGYKMINNAADTVDMSMNI